MNLETFLEKKTLFYDKIDYDCIATSWDILSNHIKLPFVIHIVGTNGKGSTGRFLASFLSQSNFKVLHYSSPHIEKFNERIWINGFDVSDESLEIAHGFLQKILSAKLIEQLTYFEYTTLLALYLSKDLDYLVLEAGLGGEFDATNVVKNNLTIMTNIGLDHQSFLGNTLKEITFTKARSCDNEMIVTYQSNEEIYSYIEELFSKSDKKFYFVKDDGENIDISIYEKYLPLYLLNNLKTVIYTLNHLKIEIKNFTLPTLFGRFQKIAKNVILDVGHNPLAAQELSKTLSIENKRYVLVFNSYKDKDFNGSLTLLKPFIDEVQIIKIEDKRVVELEVLKETLNQLKITFSDFNIKKLEDNKNYLVFGSFLVVENFLKQYKELEIENEK